MIAFKDSGAPQTTGTTYQLKVVLLGTKPPVWRRLLVPGGANLGWLHAVLQVALGWTNSHLHQFAVQGALYSDTRHHYAEFEDSQEILEACKFKLEQVAPNEGDVLRYDYDFGDSWQHDVIVERISPANPAAAKAATCVEGARACPPEDCGGFWGYENLLKVLKNRKHPDHKRMKQWVGGSFDSETFDVARISSCLTKLKWPNVTEAALRKVMMARDRHRPAS